MKEQKRNAGVSAGEKRIMTKDRRIGKMDRAHATKLQLKNEVPELHLKI